MGKSYLIAALIYMSSFTSEVEYLIKCLPTTWIFLFYELTVYILCPTVFFIVTSFNHVFI